MAQPWECWQSLIPRIVEDTAEPVSVQTTPHSFKNSFTKVENYGAWGDQNGLLFIISSRRCGQLDTLTAGDIIRFQPPGKSISRKNFDQSRQINNPFFSTRFETAPIANVLFRPEEVHGASAIGPVFGPFPKRHGRVPHQTFRFGTLVIRPSFISTRMGNPQSRHGASIRTVFPLKSQLTASDSNPH